MTNDDFLNALVNDSLDIVGTFLPIPKESLKWVFQRMKKNPMNKYLEIDRDKIHQFYNNERLHQLKFNSKEDIELLPQHVVIDNTVNHLDMSHFVFEYSEEVFEVSDVIKDQTSEPFNTLTKKISYTNDENLRLSRLEYKDGIYTFHTQPVYYKSYLHSNMLLDYPINGVKTLRDEIHVDGQLETIENSQLANHLGINILLFTPAGKLILPQRSKHVTYAPLELSASISGAVSSNDVTPGKSINQFSILREVIEELGLERADIINESIVFLGLTRELIRGGKPELFFSMQTSLTEKEIQNRWQSAKDKWENKTIQFYPMGAFVNNAITSPNIMSEFDNKIKTLFEDHGENMSLPLITNLALWIKYKRNQGLERD